MRYFFIFTLAFISGLAAAISPALGCEDHETARVSHAQEDAFCDVEEAQHRKRQISSQFQAKPTEQGHFRISIQSQVSPIPLNQPHAWVVHIESPDGTPVQPKRILLGGGMPQHGHGFPTQPSITRYLGEGDWLIEGMQFNMAGQWQVRFELLDDNGWDRATFNFSIDRLIDTVQPQWSPSELAVLKSLWIGSLQPSRQPLENRGARDAQAAALGHRLFFDPNLSANQQVSCASCHEPQRYFTDGRRLARGIGDVQRNTPSLVGTAYNHWFYWDGRRDSLWSQAIVPIEALNEMGRTRLGVVRDIARQPVYRRAYEALFGPLPKADVFERLPKRASPIGDAPAQTAWSQIAPRTKRVINKAFANIGKAIAAYERQLEPGPSRFDRYVEAQLAGDQPAAEAILTADEVAGMKLFMSGQARCLTCHNGPLMTNQGFHNIGTGVFDGETPDFGRMLGIQAVLMTEFNCRGRYSGRPPAACDKLRFMNRTEIQGVMRGAFKVPGLRNVSHTAPYMHDGRHATLAEVVQHYREPPATNGQPLHELSPVRLTDREAEQLVAFLHTLTGEIDASPKWLRPPDTNADIANPLLSTPRAFKTAPRQAQR